MQTDKLNALLLNAARGNSEMIFLASPVTGGGVNVGRVQQLFILAMSQGKKDLVELVEFVLNILTIQGQRLLKDGAVLETAEDNRAELTRQSIIFIETQWPVLRSLKVV